MNIQNNKHTAPWRPRIGRYVSNGCSMGGSIRPCRAMFAIYKKCGYSATI